MLKTFRIVSFVEGVSLIALFFIAMPAKYGYDIDLVAIAGPVHGVLWLAFLPMLEIVSRQQEWPKSFWNYAFISSVLPFGCFFLEKKLRNNAPAS
ncbi:integral membrane protein [Mariprofundus ferrinatatus]|uniref:Integral membrane protein n=1 Tax=Mariprofundus ferrinatatus TaxID=1921087 RepID=A0A2K8L5T7_9PROT|nr:DUF3817 domain-containing protein [Mariprofundus ferrinatatus]ATX81609.1 integral membrane protein [Mariprofundus ferrinatatus]